MTRDVSPPELAAVVSTDTEEYGRARLLSAFQIILTVVVAIADVISTTARPSYTIPRFCYGLLLMAWTLNRLGRYPMSAAVTLCLFPLTTLATALSGADPRLTFMYLVIPVIASSLLLGRRGAIAFNVACFAFLVVLPLVFPQRLPSWRSVLAPAILMSIGGALAIVMMIHRDEVERLRQAAHIALIRQLEQKNSELERFTYTVSHDLKSPLITVRGFLGSIAQDLKEGRSDRLGGDVERILKATTRMQRLLDELLTLSRIGRIANEPKEVPFRELVLEAVAMVRGRLDAAHAHLEIAPEFPTVFADRSRVVQVLQNLLDNAAKFLGDQKNPLITIGTVPAGDGYAAFFVRDNGVGVDPAYLERMLGLFERLDDRAEGTGVGLAIVKRIVDVHGGRLWVESAGKGQGTTVHFTLPTPPSGP